MAAFINALYEEGTLEDCRRWVRKMRTEQSTYVLDKLADDMNKAECLEEICALWEIQISKK